MTGSHRVRVLVTRPRGQASLLAGLLDTEGFQAVVVPTVELREPESWCGLDAALTALLSYDWVVFTSANGVRAFAERARVLRVPSRPKRVAAVGPATANAIAETIGQAADLVPKQFIAEALGEALGPAVAGMSVLVVGAEARRDALAEMLERAGATVTVAVAYRNMVPPGAIDALKEALTDTLTDPLNEPLTETSPRSLPEAAVFTSGSAVRNLRELLQQAGMELPIDMVLASIGPVTSSVMREVGWEPTCEAAEATLAALVSVVAERFPQA